MGDGDSTTETYTPEPEERTFKSSPKSILHPSGYKIIPMEV